MCLSIAVSSVPSHATAAAAAIASLAEIQQQELASKDIVSGAIGCLSWFIMGIQVYYQILASQQFEI